MEDTALWRTFKKGFAVWERVTAEKVEALTRNPAWLNPMAAMLSATYRWKAISDEMSSRVWGSMGLPTKRDQERTLHALNELESRLMDLEEKLAAREGR
jgi:hypothetical protein